jgi:hypothetical protein
VTTHAGGTNTNYAEIVTWFRLDSASTAGAWDQTEILQMAGTAWNGGSDVGVWIAKSGDGSHYYLSLGQGDPGTAQYTVSTNTWYQLRFVVTANNGSGNAHAELYAITSGSSWGSAISSLTGLTLGSAINNDLQMGAFGGQPTSFKINFDDTNVYSSNSTTLPPRWYTTVSWQPYVVIFNKSLGVLQSSAAAVASPGQWYWGGNTLYIYSVDNPPTDYTAPGVEVGHRQFSIIRNGQSYFTLSNLITEGANNISPTAPADVFIGEDGPGDNGTESSGVQVSGLLCRFNAREGLWFDSVGGTVSNSTFAYNGGMGVDFDTGSGMTGTNLISHDNLYGSYPGSYLSSLPNLTLNNFTAYNNASNGLSLSIGTNYTINGCQIYNNTYNGIYFDGTTVNGANIHNCEIYGNGDSGIRIGSGNATNLSLSYNVIYNNTNAGIYDLSGNTSTVAYGNTLVGNGKGLWISGAGTNINARNNISEDNTTEVQVDSSVNQTPTIDYNDWFHSAGGTFMNWKGTAYNFTNWQTNSGLDAHSFSSNPLFTNASGNNFTFQSSSPAIDAGVNLGSAYEFGLSPSSSWPSSILTLNQNLNGSAWDIGAYVYTQSTAPTVSLSAPANAATLSGTTAVTAAASAAAPASISSVAFYLDGSLLGSSSSTSSPSYSWSTTATANGSHALAAVTTDNYGNIATSSPATVTVNNVAPASSRGGGGAIVGSGPLAPGYMNTNPTAASSAVSPAVSTTTAASASSTFTTPQFPAAANSTVSFTQNGQLWDEGPDILALQRFLNTHGYILTPTGNGSPGNETDIFGPHTYRALIKFQSANNLPPTGYFGPLTRALINSQTQ